MKKNTNPLEELFIDTPLPPEVTKDKWIEREYSGYAIATKSTMALRSTTDGGMAIFWDKRIAEDNASPKEEVVKCEIKLWKAK